MNACSYRVMTEGWGLKRNKKYLKKIETSNNLWFSSRLAKPALERTRLAAYLHFRMEWTPQVVFTKMRLLKLMSLNEYINFCGSGLWVVLHTRQGESQRCPDLVMPLRYYEEPKWNTLASLEKILSVGAALKPVNTTNLASLDNLCTRGNVGNPVNTLIQHTIHFEKNYAVLNRDGSD